MPLYTRDRNGTVHDAAEQIVWAGDTNLYRSAADTLKTDDSLIVGAVLTVLGAAAFTGAVTGLTKATVGLGNVDNTADAAKPLSTAGTTALALKYDKTGGTISGAANVTGTLTAGGLFSQNYTGAGPSIKLINTGGDGLETRVAAATSSAILARVSGDTQYRFTVSAAGRIFWGDGAVGGDTSLYRSAVNTLLTPGLLSVGGLLSLAAGAAGVGGLTIGADVNLYRSAADTLKSDDTIIANGIVRAERLNSPTQYIQMTGGDATGPRISSEHATEKSLIINNNGAAGVAGAGTFIVFQRGGVETMKIGADRLYFGAAADVNIYRAGAATMAVDGAMNVGNTLSILGGVLRHSKFTTVGRPSAVTAGAGAEIYDTTLSKPMYSDGTIWRDAVGVAA